MRHSEKINHWKAVDGGFRSSVMLRVGAIILAAAALANLGTRLLAGSGDSAQTLTIVAWVLFIAGLWLIGGAFFWIGAAPFLSRFGFVVGGLHAISGVQLLFLLFTSAPTLLPAASLTLARVASLVAFAWLEREWLPRRTRVVLGGVAGLQFIKVLLREVNVLPAWGTPGGPLLDAVFLLGMAAALLYLGLRIRHREDNWAITLYETGHSDFSDFNNPEHHWNKNGTADTRGTRRIPS